MGKVMNLKTPSFFCNTLYSSKFDEPWKGIISCLSAQIFRGASLSRTGHSSHSLSHSVPFLKFGSPSRSKRLQGITKSFMIYQDPSRSFKIPQDPSRSFKIFQDLSRSFKIFQDPSSSFMILPRQHDLEELLQVNNDINNLTIRLQLLLLPLTGT